MVKKYSQVFLTFLFLGDLAIVGACWLAAYFVRFSVDLVPIIKDVPPSYLYTSMTPYALVVWALTFRVMGLYSPMRTVSKREEALKVIKASTVAVLIFIVLMFYLSDYKYSRVVFFYFWIMSSCCLIVSRLSLRIMLRYFRRKGYNLRFVLIVGAGDLGKRVFHSIKRHPELGLRVVGFLSRHQEKIGDTIEGIPILGVFEDVQEVIQSQPIDQVLVALPLEEHSRLRTVMKMIDNELVDVKIVPDIFDYITLRGGIEELDNIPIISLRDSPLQGWNRVFKRLFDLVLSILLLVIFAPLMVLIAALIKLTSSGPVLFSQERMGLDGRTFTMYKFRTMVPNAERDTGPIWTSEHDDRRTPFGALVRRFSLDELPQFFNVLKGDMSIVGPRPERTFFIQQFKEMVPRYMLRHKIKAGITGWAQVNGWRGNTSLAARIDHDIYYIENWSLLFDLKIIVMTVWKGFVDKHAY